MKKLINLCNYMRELGYDVEVIYNKSDSDNTIKVLYFNSYINTHFLYMQHRTPPIFHHIIKGDIGKYYTIEDFNKLLDKGCRIEKINNLKNTICLMK